MQLLIKGLKISETINTQWIIDNCYIAGGACVSNATRTSIHDVDIYFKTKKARDYFIKEVSDAEYITKKSKEWSALLSYDSLLTNETIEMGDDKVFEVLGLKVSSDRCGGVLNYELNECDGNGNWHHIATIPQPLFEKQKWMFKNGYDHVLLEKNHFEVDGGTFLGNKSITIKQNGLVYQFILRFYGDPQQMMDETFDFQHCKIAYDLATNQYVSRQETWESLAKKELQYVNSFYPISSLKRLYKYGARGYKWNNDQFVKIIRDIHKVDVDNKFVMEDQLIGYYEDFDYNFVFENNQELEVEGVEWNVGADY